MWSWCETEGGRGWWVGRWVKIDINFQKTVGDQLLATDQRKNKGCCVIGVGGSDITSTLGQSTQYPTSQVYSPHKHCQAILRMICVDNSTEHRSSIESSLVLIQ